MSDYAFVYRDRELQVLNTLLGEAIQSNSCRLCLISGDYGTGKSALVREFLSQLAERQNPPKVAVGNLDSPIDAGQVFLPFRQIIEELGGDKKWGKNSFAHIAGFVVRTASKVPGIVGDSGVLGPEVAIDPMSRIVFEEIGATAGNFITRMMSSGSEAGESVGLENTVFEYGNIIVRAVEYQPTVIIVENLHWADVGTSTLFKYMTSLLKDKGVLIIGTYRPVDVSLVANRSHPFPAVLAELLRDSNNTVVDLDKAREGVRGSSFIHAFFAANGGRYLSVGFRDDFRRKTGANPLFVSELYRYMQEQGLLVQRYGGAWVPAGPINWDELPSSDDVFGYRFDQLPVDLQGLLRIASVEGTTFTAEVIARVLERPVEELLPKLGTELALKYGIVRLADRFNAVDEQYHTYTFDHVRFRENVYARIDQYTRRIWHQKVAGALEELYSTNLAPVLAQLAEHYRRSGDIMKQLEYALAQVDLNVTLGANLEAMKLLRYAEEAYAKLTEKEPYIMRDIQVHKGIILDRDRKSADAIEAFSIAFDINEELLKNADSADSLGTRNLRLRSIDILLAMAGINKKVIKRSMRKKYLDQAYGRLEEFRDDTSSEVLSRRANYKRKRAILIKSTDSLESALRLYEEALADATAANDDVQIMLALNSWGTTLRQVGKTEEALTTFNQVLDLATRSGNRHVESMVLHNRGFLYRMVGKLDQAVSDSNTAWKIAELSGNQRRVRRRLTALGVNLLWKGNYYYAEDILQRAVEKERTHNEALGGYTTAHIACAQLFLNNVASAHSTIGQFIEQVSASQGNGTTGWSVDSEDDSRFFRLIATIVNMRFGEFEVASSILETAMNGLEADIQRNSDSVESNVWLGIASAIKSILISGTEAAGEIQKARMYFGTAQRLGAEHRGLFRFTGIDLLEVLRPVDPENRLDVLRDFVATMLE